MQQLELGRGQSVVLHELPEEVRNNVPVLPIEARTLMGVVQAGKDRFAIFGESSRVGNIDNVLKATADSPMIHMRMQQDPAVYYIDAQAQRYVSVGRMSQTQDGHLTVGRATIAPEVARHGMEVGLGMSREHFTLTQSQDGSLSIEDHSTNGTSVLTGMEHGAEQDYHDNASQDLGRTAILPQIEQ